MPTKPRCIQLASSPDVTAALPVASATSETPPPESSIPTEIRQPEESPSPPPISALVNKNSLAQVEDCFTPPSGVTSLSSILAEDSPAPQMVMTTRTEVLKLKADNKAAPLQIKPEHAISDRKRPLPDPETAPQQEKV